MPFPVRNHALRLSVSLVAALSAISVKARERVEQTRPSVTVYATQSGLPVDVARVGATVTVLTSEDIRAQGHVTVADALRRVPGLNVSVSGTRGTVSQVRIRGGEANHTLVILDGVAVNSPDNGAFDFAQLPVEDIARIEVIRGPQSGIFGANAHAGVIVIETKGGRGLGRVEGDASVEFGSNASFQGHARIAGGNGTAYGALSFQGARTAGTNISRFGDERDGAASTSFSAQGGIDVSPYLNFEARARLVERRAASDPQSYFGPNAGYAVDGPDRAEQRDAIASLGATTRLLDGALVSRSYVTTFRSRLDFFAPFADSISDSIRTTFGHRSTLHLPPMAGLGARQFVTVLAEHQRESFYNEGFGRIFDTDRVSTALGGEYRVDFASGLSLSGAVRNDFNQAFEDALTWRATAAYTLAATGTTIRAAAGRAVTNPTFYEQFGFFPNSFIGNPHVKPESSLGYDIGVIQRLFDGRVSIEATYFAATLDDVIQTRFLPGGLSTVENLTGTTHRRGVEVAVAIQPVHWLDLVGGYTFLDTEDPKGQRLLRRPVHTWTGEVVARFLDNALTVAGGVTHVGRREDLFFGAFPSTRIGLDPYTLVNARISYRLNPSAEVYVRGENLLNERYEDVFSYRATGAAVYAGVRLRLD